MKQKNIITAGIMAIAAGIALIVCNRDITARGVTVAGGVLFIAAGLLNGAATLTLKDETGQRRTHGTAAFFSWAVSVASLVFGICILSYSDVFIPLIPVVFGSLTALAALALFYALAIGVRPCVLPAWLYVPAVLVGIDAAMVFSLHTPAQDSLTMIYTGVGLCLFGLTVCIADACHAHKRKKAAVAVAGKEAEDAEKAG